MIDVDALKRALQERAGLDEQQATRAAEVAIAFVAEQVPQVSSLLDKAGGGESIARQIGGLFGKRD